MITSVTNNRVKNIMQLNKKAKVRREQNQYVVEGLRMVREAPLHLVKELYVSESFLQKENYREEVNKLKIPYEAVSDEVFARMCDTVTPQGILATVECQKYNLQNIIQKSDGIWLVLEDLQDPGNLGTIFRTAEGAGVSGIVMSRDTADVYNPKIIRSTMGSIYRVPFVYAGDFGAALEEMKQNGIRLYAAHLQAQSYYDAFDYKQKTAFLIGNEGQGLKKETAKRADEYLKIPMQGQVESLNAAVSAAILMYEAYRQRR